MEQCKKILEQGLKELNIVYDEAKLDALLHFIRLIEKWNKTYNLTAIRDPEEMAKWHILDSLTVLPFVHGNHLLDVGTGAGLPGIPLALFLPDVKFTLVDSNAKKTRFVQQVLLELKLKNVQVIHHRVETLSPNTKFSTVIMRAFSNLLDMTRLTHHLIDKQGILLAMKGQKPDKELNGMKQKYSIIPLDIPNVTAERCLIRIERLSKHG